MTTLNEAIKILADANNPNGWSAGPVAPNSFAQLAEHLNAGKQMIVWDGESDKTIFDDSETNYAFRAWHDAIHYKFSLPFTKSGELGAMHIQISQMCLMFPKAVELGWIAIIDAEINGQLAYQEKYGDFPSNQKEFVLAYLKDKKAALSKVW